MNNTNPILNLNVSCVDNNMNKINDTMQPWFLANFRIINLNLNNDYSQLFNMNSLTPAIANLNKDNLSGEKSDTSDNNNNNLETFGNHLSLPANNINNVMSINNIGN